MTTRLVLVAALAIAAPVAAAAAPTPRAQRPFFEPTDLELEEPGILDVDLQMGLVAGASASRLVLPDFEIDLGLLENLELDLDGTWALEGPAGGSFSPDHAAPDNLWLSLKIGVLDRRDLAAGTAWVAGVQVGPKLPAARGTAGLGIEGVVLLGRVTRRLHTVLDFGGFVDPEVAPDGHRPTACEVGVDLDLLLDRAGRWKIEGDLAATLFVSAEAHQLVATLGLTLAVREDLDLSISGLYGPFGDGDRAGVLLGISPKFRLFDVSRR